MSERQPKAGSSWWHWPSWPGACGPLFVGLVILGCASVRKGPRAAQDVVLARQLSLQGLDAVRQGQYADAEDRFREAIERCPSNTTARFQLANCLWKRGEQQAAVEQLTEASDLSGNSDVGMLVELGYMHAHLGNLTQSLELSDQAIRVAPDHGEAWHLRGDVLREQGDLRGALAAYHRVLSHDPDNLDVRMAAAELHQQQGQPVRALAALNYLDQQIPLSHQPDRMVLLKSQALVAQRRWGEAQELLQAALESRSEKDGPPSVELQAELARTQIAAGNLAAARETIRDVLPKMEGEALAEMQRLLTQTAQRSRHDVRR